MISFMRLDGRGCDIRIVNYLLDQGADVSSQCLAVSLEHDHMEVFNTLIKRGVDVNAVSFSLTLLCLPLDFKFHLDKNLPSSIIL